MEVSYLPDVIVREFFENSINLSTSRLWQIDVSLSAWETQVSDTGAPLPTGKHELRVIPMLFETRWAVNICPFLSDILRHP